MFSHYVIFLFPDWSVFILFIAAMVTSCRNHWDYILKTEALLGDSYDHSVGNPFKFRNKAFPSSGNSSFKRTYSNGLKQIPFLVGITSSSGFQYCLISTHTLFLATVQYMFPPM